VADPFELGGTSDGHKGERCVDVLFSLQIILIQCVVILIIRRTKYAELTNVYITSCRLNIYIKKKKRAAGGIGQCFEWITFLDGEFL